MIQQQLTLTPVHMCNSEPTLNGQPKNKTKRKLGTNDTMENSKKRKEDDSLSPLGLEHRPVINFLLMVGRAKDRNEQLSPQVLEKLKPKLAPLKIVCQRLRSKLSKKDQPTVSGKVEDIVNAISSKFKLVENHLVELQKEVQTTIYKTSNQNYLPILTTTPNNGDYVCLNILEDKYKFKVAFGMVAGVSLEDSKLIKVTLTEVEHNYSFICKTSLHQGETVSWKLEHLTEGELEQLSTRDIVMMNPLPRDARLTTNSEATSSTLCSNVNMYHEVEALKQALTAEKLKTIALEEALGKSQNSLLTTSELMASWFNGLTSHMNGFRQLLPKQVVDTSYSNRKFTIGPYICNISVEQWNHIMAENSTSIYFGAAAARLLKAINVSKADAKEKCMDEITKFLQDNANLKWNDDGKKASSIREYWYKKEKTSNDGGDTLNQQTTSHASNVNSSDPTATAPSNLNTANETVSSPVPSPNNSTANSQSQRRKRK